MRKNVASQFIAAQLINKSTGASVTSGTCTVYVTKDGGTQASGGGTVTHEGNGEYSYAPTQAETNATHVAFTWTHTDAVTVTINVYPVAYDYGDAAGLGLSRLDAAISTRSTYAGGDTSGVTTLLSRVVGTVASGTHNAQSGDTYARLGAPAGASVSADILVLDNLVDDLESRLGTPSNLGSGATVAANLVDIEGQTDDIGAAGAGLTALASAAALAVVDGIVDSILVDTGTTLDALIRDLPTNAELATALAGADDAVLAAIAALNNLSAAQVNAEVVDAISVDTYAQPGQGNPAATTTLAEMLGLLYKAWRNPKAQTDGLFSLFADNGTTLDQKAVTAFDGTTFTQGKMITGA